MDYIFIFTENRKRMALVFSGCENQADAEDQFRLKVAAKNISQLSILEVEKVLTVLN